MKKVNSIEKELNTIRIDLYEKTKDMSPSEMNAYIHAQVAPALKKYGIKTVGGPKSDARRAV